MNTSEFVKLAREKTPFKGSKKELEELIKIGENISFEDDCLSQSGVYKTVQSYLKSLKGQLEKMPPDPEPVPEDVIQDAKALFESSDLVKALIDHYETAYESVKEHRENLEVILYSMLGIYNPRSHPVIHQLIGDKGTGKSTLLDAIVDLTYNDPMRVVKGKVKPASFIRCGECLDKIQPNLIAVDDLDFDADENLQDNIKTLMSVGKGKELLVTNPNSGKQIRITIPDRVTIVNTKVDIHGDDQIQERSLIHQFYGSYYDENEEYDDFETELDIDKVDHYKKVCRFVWSQIPYPINTITKYPTITIRKPITKRNLEIVKTIARGIAIARSGLSPEVFVTKEHVLDAVKYYTDLFVALPETNDGNYIIPELDRALLKDEKKIFEFLLTQSPKHIWWTDLKNLLNKQIRYVKRALWGREKKINGKNTYPFDGLLYLLKDYVEYNKDDKNVAFEWLGFELSTKKNTIKSYSDLIFFKEDRNKRPFCSPNWPNEPNTANKANLNSNPISVPKWNGDYSGIMIEGMPYEDYLVVKMEKNPDEVPKLIEVYKEKNSWIYELPESFTTDEALNIAEKHECAKYKLEKAYVSKSYVERTLEQCRFRTLLSSDHWERINGVTIRPIEA